MVYGAPVRLFFSVMYSSQIYMNSFSFKYVISRPGVAINKSCGKASGYNGLRLNMSKSKQSETILDKGYAKKLETFSWDRIILLIILY